MLIMVECMFMRALFTTKCNKDCTKEKIPLPSNFLVALNATLNLEDILSTG